MNGSLGTYNPYNFKNKRNENVQIYICKAFLTD